MYNYYKCYIKYHFLVFCFNFSNFFYTLLISSSGINPFSKQYFIAIKLSLFYSYKL